MQSGLTAVWNPDQNAAEVFKLGGDDKVYRWNDTGDGWQLYSTVDTGSDDSAPADDSSGGDGSAPVEPTQQ
jgi:hypothetical protein